MNFFENQEFKFLTFLTVFRKIPSSLNRCLSTSFGAFRPADFLPPATKKVAYAIASDIIKPVHPIILPNSLSFTQHKKRSKMIISFLFLILQGVTGTWWNIREYFSIISTRKKLRNQRGYKNRFSYVFVTAQITQIDRLNLIVTEYIYLLFYHFWLLTFIDNENKSELRFLHLWLSRKI